MLLYLLEAERREDYDCWSPDITYLIGVYDSCESRNQAIQQLLKLTQPKTNIFENLGSKKYDMAIPRYALIDTSGNLNNPYFGYSNKQLAELYSYYSLKNGNMSVINALITREVELNHTQEL